MLKLYDCTTAPSPRRTRMLLAEKGLDYENIQIDLATGEQLGADFRAVNPRCTVPAFITEDGDLLTENAGIAAYCEAIKPEPALLGATPLEKARIAEWNWRVEFEGLSAIAEALRNSSPAMKDRAMTGPTNVAQIPELAQRGRERLTRFLEDLNAQLSNNEYVAGEHYSVADITATVVIDFARWIKIYPADDHSATKAWHERMKARPNYKA